MQRTQCKWLAAFLLANGIVLVCRPSRGRARERIPAHDFSNQRGTVRCNNQAGACPRRSRSTELPCGGEGQGEDHHSQQTRMPRLTNNQQIGQIEANLRQGSRLRASPAATRQTVDKLLSDLRCTDWQRQHDALAELQSICNCTPHWLSAAPLHDIVMSCVAQLTNLRSSIARQAIMTLKLVWQHCTKLKTIWESH